MQPTTFHPRAEATPGIPVHILRPEWVWTVISAQPTSVPSLHRKSQTRGPGILPNRRQASYAPSLHSWWCTENLGVPRQE